MTELELLLTQVPEPLRAAATQRAIRYPESTVDMLREFLAFSEGDQRDLLGFLESDGGLAYPLCPSRAGPGPVTNPLCCLGGGARGRLRAAFAFGELAFGPGAQILRPPLQVVVVVYVPAPKAGRILAQDFHSSASVQKCPPAITRGAAIVERSVLPHFPRKPFDHPDISGGVADLSTMACSRSGPLLTTLYHPGSIRAG